MLIINRNAESSLLELIISDEDGGGTRFDSVKNPVDIKITAPDASQQPVTLKLEKWYITSIQPHSPGLMALVLQDVRWTAEPKRLTKGYNVYETGSGVEPIPRQDTLNNGADWTCYDAARDALTEFGFELDTDGISNQIKAVILPRNLGNSGVAGGFVGAPFSFVMATLLGPINCDFVVRPNGKIRIINRNFDRTTNLEEFVGVGGVIGDRDIHWQKPKIIEVQFETRVARYFSYTESETTVDGLDLGLENVHPVTLVVRNLFDVPDDGGYYNLFSSARTEVGLSLSQIRERWLKPRMVIVNNTDLKSVKAHKAKWDNLIRQHFRQTFRVRDLTGAKSMVDIRVGHLGPNGSTVTERCVYMPFTRHYDFTNVDVTGTPDEILSTTISQGTPLDLTEDGFIPAPFHPLLFADRRNGAIILQLQKIQSEMYLTLHPGLFVREVQFGDVADITADNVDLPTVYQAHLASNFYMRVYYHGLLTGDRPDLGITRITKAQRDGFGDGEVDSVSFFVSDITANYGYETKKDLANNSLILLNADEIAKRADFVAEQVKRNFVDGRAGIFTCGGVSSIVDGGFWVDGTIQTMQLVIGGRSPWSVETRYVVMPEVNAIKTAKVTQGPPVYRVGGA
ncbi:MAG: hypothetical protein M5U25_21120 [Planctomycetota bacterium]|nr:hypothetical protein [Planctomycetota bacterium]